ncbi:MAG: hypothetical protein HQL93_12990 [Magnetococcales bacterium]|nr:hypothetical protein [Magnetococcales bacterium]
MKEGAIVNNDLIIQLINCYGDDVHFFSCAMQIASLSARSGHNVFAKRLMEEIKKKQESMARYHCCVEHFPGFHKDDTNHQPATVGLQAEVSAGRRILR